MRDIGEHPEWGEVAAWVDGVAPARPRLTAEWHHLSAAADAVHRARTLAHTAPGSDALDAEITDAIERLRDARGAIHRRGQEAP